MASSAASDQKLRAASKQNLHDFIGLGNGITGDGCDGSGCRHLEESIAAS
ncbi:unnamed protein product [Arabis nemorensis]|uniref:Uncharacterized protein n=1 Tax=Arabis nemorensis TaxID=586526 RepID=A0A565CFT5_9BRAS|nr:unnamed protein product [Arabis nemorensis]